MTKSLLLCTTALLLSAALAYGQAPTRLEYFIDVDPGVGRATGVEVSGDPSMPTAFQVSVGDLDEGFHVLYVRALDETWGLPDARSFYVHRPPPSSESRIEALEYFIDTDPGLGAGRPIAVEAGAAVVEVPSSGLVAGFHTLYVRALNSDGEWGAAEARQFYLYEVQPLSEQPIVALEYFIGSDPGIGKAVEVKVAVPSVTVDLTELIPMDGLEKGAYTIGVRVRGEDGSWSVTDTRAFTIIDADAIAPERPENLSADGQPDQIVLTWTANTEPDVDWYRIYRSISDYSLYDSVAAGATSFADRAVTEETVYKYRITAVDASGNESAFSEEVSAALSGTSATPLTQPALSSPADRHIALGETVQLTWEAVDQASAYRVEVGSTSSFGSKVYENDAVTSTSVAVSLSPDRIYYWRVRATSANATASPWSAVREFAIYPSSVTQDVSQTFGGGNETRDYRMLSLPGAASVAIRTAFSGTANVDWAAFGDPGSGALVDASLTGEFAPGIGYWVVSVGSMQHALQVSAVSLSSEGEYGIPLHAGWNIIANPYGIDVPWDAIAAANPGITQPAWSYAGSYSQAVTLKPFAGYYYNNTTGLSRLEIPYLAGAVSAGKNDSEIPLLHITASQDDLRTATAVGTHPDAHLGLDRYDVFAPPSVFETLSLVIEGGANRRLARDVRPKVGEGFVVDLSLTAAGEVLLSAEGLEQLHPHEVHLFDPQLARLYDLGREPAVSLSPAVDRTALKLVIGSKSFAESIAAAELPREITLRGNYPNPFNPSTTIEYGVPSASDVHLAIFDVLGRRLRVLTAGRVEAGWHRVEWDGCDDAGIAVASGMYFARLESGRRVTVRGMNLIN